jgi:hypothetical protein
MTSLHYLEASRNVYQMTLRHIPEQEDHRLIVLKISASVGFNFVTAMLLDILLCWDVKPCLGVISETAVA